MAHSFRVARRKPDHRGTDVNDGNDELLNSEHYKLDALVDVEDSQPFSSSHVSADELLDRGRDLEKKEVDDDHEEHSAEDLWAAHNEVQTRV